MRRRADRACRGLFGLLLVAATVWIDNPRAAVAASPHSSDEPAEASSGAPLSAKYSTWQEQLQRDLLRMAESGEPALRQAAVDRLVPRLPDRQYVFLGSSPSGPDPVPAALSDRLHVAADELFSLAESAATIAPEASYRWLHEVLFLDPDHRQARRILGHVQVGGRWHPAPPPRVSVGRRPHTQLRWPARRYWEVRSANFEILTNAGRDAGLQLAEQLETLHTVWRQVFFSFWGGAQRLQGAWREPGPWPPRPPMKVVLFANREQYLAYLSPFERQIDLTLGYYAYGPGVAFFYVGDLSLLATRRHEVTHQLFHQRRISSTPVQTDTCFGLIEGIAIYMESLQLFPGYATIGGIEAERLQSARHLALVQNQHVPFTDLLSLGQEAWQSDSRIRQLYSQAAGLTHFLIDAPSSEAPTNRDVLFDILETLYRIPRDEGQVEPPAASDSRNSSALPSAPVSRGTSSDQRGASPWTRHRARFAEWDQAYREYLRIDDRQLEQVLLVNRPRRLALGGTRVTIQGIRAIAGAGQLEWLDLTGLPIDDTAAEVLSQLDRLQYLGLAGTRIGDRGATALAELKNLRQLDLRDTGVSQEAKQAMRQRRPDLEVQ